MSNDKKAHREWSPRVWEGSDFFAWLRMLARNRFAVEPKYWYLAGIVSGVTLCQTILRWLQHGLHGERIARTKITHPPLFVLGHWRTGTTLLHELLILDPRHASTTTLQCFEPCHFLLSEGFMTRYANFLLPDKRPMDNMAAGWLNPQEDEFALALLGQPSTYTDFAFPNCPPMFPGALDLSGLNAKQLQSWKRTLLYLVQAATYRDPRRLVLKSPPHTARVPMLLELFPDAKFVHIKRDPYTLFSSTINLWTSMSKRHGFQTARDTEGLKRKVFREFRLIHNRYEQAKHLIPPGSLVEVKYEDLVGDLVNGVKNVYDGLNLGGFDAALPALEAYANRNRKYEANKYQLDVSLRDEITREWGDIIVAQGYAVKSSD